MPLPLVPETIAHKPSQKRKPRPSANLAIAVGHQNVPVGVHLRRRKLPSIRLGGKKPRKVVLLSRLLKRIKLRWLKLQYFRLIRKIKEYYRGVIKDMIEAGSTLEAYQQRLVMETSFAALNFSSFPYNPSDRRPYVL